MNISRIELFHIEIPCLKPFETSFGVISSRPALIVKMYGDEGVVGYGESSPLAVPISEPEVVSDALRLLPPILTSLVGASVDDAFDVTAVSTQAQYPVSLIGVEGAYLDLLARSKGIPMGAQLGATRPTVLLGESVGLCASTTELLNEVEKYVNAGILRIKLKIAQGRDIELVRAVREAFPSLYLGVDANADYTSAHVEHLSALAAYNLVFVEQPFAAGDIESHVQLQKRGVPICLDESIDNLASCVRAVEAGACDMINIKPARIGSFKESRAIHDYCVEAGVKLFGGGRLETGVGKTMNTNFYALPGFTEASDITPPRDYLETDIVSPPFVLSDNAYALSAAPGLGLEVDDAVLQKVCIQKLIFS